MPTFANLAGFKVPDDRPIDGIDQTDLLLGEADKGRDTFLYMHLSHVNGIRKGPWKFLNAKQHVAGYATDKKRPQVEELYNLATDIGERNNVAKKHPEIVSELKALMKAKSPKDTKALDGPNVKTKKK